jgi:hypothetical protein
MPRARVIAEKLTAAAGGTAQVAAHYADTFTAARVPADFVAHLDTAASSREEPATHTTNVRCPLESAVSEITRGLPGKPYGPSTVDDAVCAHGRLRRPSTSDPACRIGAATSRRLNEGNGLDRSSIHV